MLLSYSQFRWNDSVVFIKSTVKNAYRKVEKNTRHWFQFIHTKKKENHIKTGKKKKKKKS